MQGWHNEGEGCMRSGEQTESNMEFNAAGLAVYDILMHAPTPPKQSVLDCECWHNSWNVSPLRNSYATLYPYVISYSGSSEVQVSLMKFWEEKYVKQELCL